MSGTSPHSPSSPSGRHYPTRTVGIIKNHALSHRQVPLVFSERHLIPESFQAQHRAQDYRRWLRHYQGASGTLLELGIYPLADHEIQLEFSADTDREVLEELFGNDARALHE